MNDLDHPHADPHALIPAAHAPMVPAPFAEKAMASLMQLHGELMEEKERRVDLYRRLMEKEQAVAELRMYVQMLEEKLGVAPKAPQMPDTPVTPDAPRHRPPASAHPVNAQRVQNVAPTPPRIDGAPRRPVQSAPPPQDGWRAW